MFKQLRASFEKSITLFDKEKAQERLSKLSGGVAVIKVGGASEAEVGEKKDRVTDALNAARAAVEEGIVPGGGVALLYATRELERVQTSNSDEKRGVQIIENALKAPSFTIVANAGADASLVLGKLLEHDNLKLGYDASKGYVSLLLTTTEAAIVELEDTKSNPAMNIDLVGGRRTMKIFSGYEVKSLSGL
ncbi:hypothetical protein Taro_035997 [Colocasia esculenta]|uniref:Uncharacterized protein n=1 Tax=Colocasia esculenta TaxID=4460 RepID=A0A843WEY2_COLES|nr:hypothetical protein [Colocasia esculenta]